VQLPFLKIQHFPKYWGAWFVPIGDGEMKETNLNIFYQLGAALDHLQQVTFVNMDASDLLIYLVLPKEWLRIFLEQTREFPGLEKTRAAATTLMIALQKIMEGYPANPQRKLTDVEVVGIMEAKDQMEKNLEREHLNLPVFTVTEKGIYNLRLLIEQTEKKFSEKIRGTFSENTICDLKQAGKCLAFEVPTACAFHVCRATEALMLTYYEALSGHPWSFKKRDWNIYIEQLRVEGAPDRITTRLDEIRDMDRNPYIHPDTVVTLEEAPIVFELCTGVMFFMAQQINERKN
jgi:hypothetical protein